MKQYFFILFLFLALPNLFAQQVDSVASMAPKKISLENTSEDIWLPKPKTATLLSTIVPGLGQAYNRSYWKIPLIYAIEGTLVYLIIDNNKNYKSFKEAYRIRTDASSTKVDQYINHQRYKSADQLRLARDDYRRNRDLSIVIAAAVYGMQILDASVDAHLRSFRVNKELSLELNPYFYKYNAYNFASGISLTLKWDTKSDKK
jgi:hypothetical protein